MNPAPFDPTDLDVSFFIVIPPDELVDATGESSPFVQMRQILLNEVCVPNHLLIAGAPDPLSLRVGSGPPAATTPEPDLPVYHGLRVTVLFSSLDTPAIALRSPVSRAAVQFHTASDTRPPSLVLARFVTDCFAALCRCRPCWVFQPIFRPLDVHAVADYLQPAPLPAAHLLTQSPTFALPTPATTADHALTQLRAVDALYLHRAWIAQSRAQLRYGPDDMLPAGLLMPELPRGGYLLELDVLRAQADWCRHHPRPTPRLGAALRAIFWLTYSDHCVVRHRMARSAAALDQVLRAVATAAAGDKTCGLDAQYALLLVHRLRDRMAEIQRVAAQEMRDGEQAYLRAVQLAPSALGPHASPDFHDTLLAAARLGNGDAQFNYGVCCAVGRGRDVDLPQAVFWYELATNQGHARAFHNLAVCHYRGLGVPKNERKAAHLFCEAVRADIPESMYGLATLFQNGLGVERNVARAHKLDLLAAQRGHAKAQARAQKRIAHGLVPTEPVSPINTDFFADVVSAI